MTEKPNKTNINSPKKQAMELKQILKAIFKGFCIGVALVWMLVIILTIVMGANTFEFIGDCSKDIFLFSVRVGCIFGVVWIFVSNYEIKRRKREELENEMREYFHKQNKRED